MKTFRSSPWRHPSFSFAGPLGLRSRPRPQRTTRNITRATRWRRLARVSIDEARAIAPKARPGKVTDQELEKEAGGSSLRYSFDIKSQAKTFEVGVDAKSGEVLENAAEGRHPD